MDEKEEVVVTTAKPWYKRTKVLYAISGVLLSIIGLVVSKVITVDAGTAAEIMSIAEKAFTISIVVITGHTLTDISSMFKKK